MINLKVYKTLAAFLCLQRNEIFMQQYGREPYKNLPKVEKQKLPAYIKIYFTFGFEKSTMWSKSAVNSDYENLFYFTLNQQSCQSISFFYFTT